MRSSRFGRRAVLALALAAFGFQFVRSAPAQFVDSDEAPVRNSGFSMPKEDEKFDNAMEDFKRYRDKKQWEAAFRILSTLSEGPLKGMAARGDGFMVPSRQLILQNIASLPPEGREAYRLFFDAKAKQLFEQATRTPSPDDGSDAVADDVPQLRKIVDQFFFTSVGDRAADRLGDAFFESGNFSAAADQWNRILTLYPDSGLPALRIRVKHALALARLGRWEAFDAAVKTIGQKFPGESLTLGGESRDAVSYLQSIKSAARVESPKAVAETPNPTLPESDTEAWQLVLVDEQINAAIQARLQQMGWDISMSGISDLVPAAAADDNRVYANVIGTTVAVDVATGKLAWRNGKFLDVNRAIQLVQNSFEPERFGLTQNGNRVFVIGAPIDEAHPQPTFPLICLDTKDGKERWSTRTGQYTNFQFMGNPLIAEETLWTVATDNSNSNLQLLGLDPETGKPRFAMTLGTAATSSDFHGRNVMPLPTLHYEPGTLFVLTNNGALLAVDLGGKTIRWALRMEVEVGGGEMNPFFMRRYGLTTNDAPPALLMDGGVLYCKEERSSTLYAVDTLTPAVKWKRPLAREETVVGVRDGRLLTSGSDAGMIDLATKKLLWSARISEGSAPARPLVGKDQMLIAQSRGLFLLSSETGDVLKMIRGADKGSCGGTLMRCGDKLITISNHAITAYPLSKDASASTTQTP